jgi:hypothetical protein
MFLLDTLLVILTVGTEYLAESGVVWLVPLG